MAESFLTPPSGLTGLRAATIEDYPDPVMNARPGIDQTMAWIARHLAGLVGHPNPNISLGMMPTNPSKALEKLITLYRGETPSTSISTRLPEWVRGWLNKNPEYAATAGRWFTQNPDIAQWYAQDAGPLGLVKSVAVPKSIADAAYLPRMKQAIPNLRSADPMNEFLLPPEWAKRAK